MVTLGEVKQYLRIDFDDEDALLEDLIRTAEKICADVLRTDDVAHIYDLPNGKTAVLYTIAVLYDQRTDADLHMLTLTLRAFLFGDRKPAF